MDGKRQAFTLTLQTKNNVTTAALPNPFKCTFMENALSK